MYGFGGHGGEGKTAARTASDKTAVALCLAQYLRSAVVWRVEADF